MFSHFLTQTLGYAISDPNLLGRGAVLLRTPDGGQSFQPVDPGLEPIQWVQFVSAQLGWAAGPLGIAVTRDGGVHWAGQLAFSPGAFDQGSPDYPPAWTAQVGFRDSSHGFAYYRTQDTVMNQSGGIVYYRADGGRTWRGEACTCGYVPVAQNVLLGAKSTLAAGRIDSDLDVTGSVSASIVDADGVMNQTQVCTTFCAGAGWACSQLPFVKFAPGRMASLGATRWLVLTVTDQTEVVIATSLDGGASWSLRTRVTIG